MTYNQTALDMIEVHERCERNVDAMRDIVRDEFRRIFPVGARVRWSYLGCYHEGKIKRHNSNLTLYVQNNVTGTCSTIQLTQIADG